MRSFCLLFIALLVLYACDSRERNCLDFRVGTFYVESEQDGQTVRSRFRRTGDYEYDYFEGRIDTSRVRWVNDCECILQKVNPSNALEKKPIHIRILYTTDSTYTFEYGYLNDATKLRGTAYRTNTADDGDL